jgi:hypothetical protein
MAPLILSLGIRWRLVVKFTSWALYPHPLNEKEFLYTLNRRMDGPPRGNLDNLDKR